MDRSKLIALVVLLFPSLVGMLFFVMLPILVSLVLSFSQWNMIGDINWIGWRNYRQILVDPNVHAALLNTLTFIVGYLPSVIVIALGLALLLDRKSVV